MAQIPSYDVWMKQTQSFRHRRSSLLVKVDETIKSFPNDKKRIKDALDRWKFEQSRQRLIKPE